MTTPYRATPFHWSEIQRTNFNSAPSCILELRDRLAAVERQLSELEGNSSAGLTGSNHPEPPNGSGPAGLLVAQVNTAAARAVLDAMHCSYDHEPTRRAIAADVLRALADQVVPLDLAPTGMRLAGDTYFAQEIRRGQRQITRSKILAIAAKLSGTSITEGNQ